MRLNQSHKNGPTVGRAVPGTGHEIVSQDMGPVRQELRVSMGEMN